MDDVKNIYLGDKKVEQIFTDSSHKTEILQIYLNNYDKTAAPGVFGLVNSKDGIVANDSWQYLNSKGNNLFTKTLIFDSTPSFIEKQSSAVGIIFDYAVQGYQEYSGNVLYGRNWIRLDKNNVSDYTYHYETLDDSSTGITGIINATDGTAADTSWKFDTNIQTQE